MEFDGSLINVKSELSPKPVDVCGRDDNIREVEVTHEELMSITSKTLNDVLNQDTILNDLPADVTLEEVTSEIAVQHGQSMTIYIIRDDGEEIPVVVHQKGAKVIDLKRAIQRRMVIYMKRKGAHSKISWRYIWKSNYLVFDNEKLKNDQSLLSDFGIRNKSRLTFIKRHREKGASHITNKTILLSERDIVDTAVPACVFILISTHKPVV